MSLVLPTGFLPLRSESYDGASSVTSFGIAPKAVTAQTVYTRSFPVANAIGIQYLMSRMNATPEGLRLGLRDAGAVYSIVWGANSSGAVNQPQQETGADFAYGVWADIAATWDGSLLDTGMMSYYAAGNNVLVSAGATGAGNGLTAADSNAADAYLIGDRIDNLRPWLGYIAFVAHWDRVLHLEELRKVQWLGPLAVPSGLFLCWANGRDHSQYKLRPTTRTAITTGSTARGIALKESRFLATEKLERTVSAVYLPRRWQRQPTGPVRIAKTPLTEGLYIALCPWLSGHDRYFNAADPTNHGGVGNNAAVLGTGPHGRALVGVGATFYSSIIFPKATVVVPAGGRQGSSAIAVYNNRGTDRTDGVVGAFAAGEAGALSDLIVGIEDGVISVRWFAGGLRLQCATTVPATGPFVAGWSVKHKGLNTLNGYLNGALDGTADPNIDLNAVTFANALGWFNSYAATNTSVSLMLAWNRFLDSHEHAALAADPWQVFERGYQQRYFSVAEEAALYSFNDPLMFAGF